MNKARLLVPTVNDFIVIGMRFVAGLPSFVIERIIRMESNADSGKKFLI